MIALAALTGLLAVGCAPHDSHQGGDLSASESGQGSGSSESPAEVPSRIPPSDEAAPPAEPRSQDQPSGLRPPEGDSDDASPDGFFHRQKNASIHI